MTTGNVIGNALVQIIPDLSRFGVDLKRQISQAAGQAGPQLGRDLQRPFDDAGAAADGFGSKIKGIAAAAGAAFAGVQVGQFIKEGIDQAADLGESINAIKVVLGDAADSFLEFGKSAANELGITQSELNQTLVPMASLLKNAGLSGEDLSGKLQDVATRATDVASVFNKDVTEVLNAFGAAVRGETEPIRALGVNFDQAAIQAKAVELGLAASTKEVDKAAQAQAALALIMDQTAQAQGDFANTANSLPNLMKRFTATLDETKGALGQGLLPVVSQILQTLLPAVTQLVPVFQSIGTALVPIVTGIGSAIERLAPLVANVFADIAESFAPIGELLPQLAETIAPVIGTIGNLISSLLPPILIVITALLKAADPFISFFASIVNVVVDSLAPTLSIVAGIIGQLAEVFVEAMGAINSEGGLEAVFTAIGDTLTELAPVLTMTAQILASTLAGAFKQIAPVLAQVITLFANFLQQALRDLAPFLPKLAQLFGRLIESLMPLLPIILDLATMLLEALQPVLPQLADSFILIIEALLPLIPPLVKLIEIIAPLAPILIGLALIIGGPGTVGGFIAGLVGITMILQQLWPVIQTVARAIGGFFVDAFRTARDTITGFVNFFWELPGRLANAAIAIGRAMANALIDTLNLAIQMVNSFIPNSVGLGPVSIDLPDNPLPKIPRLQTGGFTLGSGLAMLHPNEMVLPLNSDRGVDALAAAIDRAGGAGIVFNQGAIQVTFAGAVPTEAEALRTGQAVGDGIADALERRKIRTAMRVM